MSQDLPTKIIGSNRKAFHDYTIAEKIEAGLILKGTEVKSLREGRVNLREAYATVAQGKAVLHNCHIGEYSHGNIMNHEEKRDRRLLLHKRELVKLTRATQEKGFSIVPIKIYFKGHYIKLEIALGKGKKSFDKRESAKQKDANREIARAMRARG